MPKRIDMTGQQFGELTVVKLSDKRDHRGTRFWECLCSCGKTIYALGTALRAGHYKSCGCIRDQKRDAGMKAHIDQDRVDQTRKSALQAKLHKANKSGHKGVMWLEKRQKWLAYIGFQNKNINLGYFELKSDAIKAREIAEEKYYRPYLDER